jgi:hypothetical protein
MVGKGHQHASVDETVLLPMFRRDIDSRFTPTLAPRRQLNSQRLHELGVAEYPLDQ